MTPEEKAVAEALAALEKQDQSLTEQILDLEYRRARVRTARAALSPLVNDEPTEFEGKLADAIRTVLKAKHKSYQPTQVRDLVKQLGYVFKPESNQMAAVHGVLKRLKQSDEVAIKEWKKQPGITRYYWAEYTDVDPSRTKP